MHGVVHGLEDAQDGAQRLLEVLSPLAAPAVLQHLLGVGERACVHTLVGTHTFTPPLKAARTPVLCVPQVWALGGPEHRP